MLTLSYSGFLGTDGPTNLSELPLASTSGQPDSPVGTYPITLTGGSAANYRLVLNNGTLTVTPVGLTVSADNASRSYGATNPVFSGSLTGIRNGDNITATYTSSAAPASPVGTYPITIGLLDPDHKLSNYTVRPPTTAP